MSRTLFVLQGGGPTAVINATLSGIAEKAAGNFDRLLGFRHSFEQPADKPLLDLSGLLQSTGSVVRLRTLADTPGAILGSSRKKVEESDLQLMVETLRRHHATDLIGIGGNGTMSVLDSLSRFAQTHGWPLNIVGAPKTVDNDLPGVHAAPGYGSAARLVALAVRDYDCDFRAMSTFDNVTILETMGRNCGWLAAASTLFKHLDCDAPHIVLLPEQSFDQTSFLDRVAHCHSQFGRVFIVTNEMLSDTNGAIVGEQVQNGPRDALGRAMYSLSSGTGNYLADLIWTTLDLQTRCLRPGNLGRSMSFCQSSVDRQLAIDAGRYAANTVLAEQANHHMIGIDEQLNFSNRPLQDAVGEKPLPEGYIDQTVPFQIDNSFKNYVARLVGHIDPLFDRNVLETLS